MASPPLLHISNGTRFGYRAGWPWQRIPRCLVQTSADITTGPGLHLLVAPNGSGKTTLLRALAGLAPALAGQVKAQGRVHYFADELKADPEITARTFFRSWFKGDAIRAAEHLAETLRLDLSCQIGKLSRGNRQKVLLILAEIQASQFESSILLMDEPLTGLDAETREQVTQLWADSGSTAMRLVIMHELECVRKADSLLTITRGELHHATTRVGESWMNTYHTLQQ